VAIAVDAVENVQGKGVVEAKDNDCRYHARRRDQRYPVDGEKVEEEAEEIGGVEGLPAFQPRDNYQRADQRKPGEKTEPVGIKRERQQKGPDQKFQAAAPDFQAGRDNKTPDSD